LDGASCPISAGFAPDNKGVRFDRLGQRCTPGAVGCGPVLDLGVDVVMNAAASGSTFCIYETTTGVSRLVRVAPGGRVVTLP
jgi:hypothetical protein